MTPPCDIIEKKTTGGINMKRYIRSAAVIVTALITLLCGTVTANAMGLFECEINIYSTNAPEGTVFADILFPKVEGDVYAPDKDSDDYRKKDVCNLVSVDNKKIELDDDCGLARYDDGFTSCMMRRYFVGCNYADSERSNLRWSEPTDDYNHNIFEYYRQFKVAFCDKDGNVIAVTEPVKVKLRNNCMYEIYTDGVKAEYKVIKDGAVWLTTFIIIAIMAIPVLIISALFVVIIKKIEKKKKALPEGQETVRSFPFPVVVLIVLVIAAYFILRMFGLRL